MQGKYAKGLEKIRTGDGNDVANYKAGLKDLKQIKEGHEDYGRAKSMIKSVERRLTSFERIQARGK